MTATYRYPEAIIAPEALQNALRAGAVRAYECTTFLEPPTPGIAAPYTVRAGRAEYDAGHIAGAAFIDLQADLSDNSAPAHLRFTMPSPEALAAKARAIGIGDGHRVVLYARGNMQWATRVWWMLRAIGFDNAAVLDGGFDRWTAQGRPVATELTVHPPAASLAVTARPSLFAGRDAVQAAMGDASVCTLNALGAELHRGESDRYGRPGRIPGSVNVPAVALQDPGNRSFATSEQAARHFAEVGLSPDQRVIVYCGGGIAATLDAFLLVQLGYDDVAVYDASMSEWAKDESLPMEVG